MTDKELPSRRFNLTLGQKGIILIGVPMLFEMVFLLMLYLLLVQAERAADQYARSNSKISTAGSVTRLFITVGGTLGLYSMQKSPTLAEQFEVTAEQIPRELEQLKKLCRDNPRQMENLAKIENNVTEGLAVSRKIKESLDQRGEAAGTYMSGVQLVKKLRRIISSMEEDMNKFLEEERRMSRATPIMADRARQMVRIVLFMGTGLNIVLALLMARLFYTGITGRLRILTDNSLRLARSEPLFPVLEGSDEVAHLDRVFHEMADALAEAARKERAIIENALDVICSIDENLKFTAVSPASVQVWGYAPEELIGRRFTELLDPDDIETTLEATTKIVEEKSLMPFENRIIRKDGAAVHILWSAYWSNTERSMFCVAHDITERKRAEEMLRASETRTRAIIETMPVGLMLLNERGDIEVVNPQMVQMFGFEAEHLVGTHVSCLFPKAEEFYPANFKDYRKLIGRVREWDALRKSGEVFPSQLSFNEFETRDGMRVLINILDVTERHLMEQLKREFVTTVSHELRTPLTSIRGSLGLLAVGALGPLAEQASRAVRIAERNALRLISLINDLLDIEKLEAGKVDMVYERVSMSAVVDRSLESVRSFADQWEISLVANVSECVVCADGDRLVQVLVNLLSNACKYSPRERSVELVVKADKDLVTVSVTDHGRGIPEDAKARVFERFQQIDSSDAKKKGGTGLGLAISKSIIEQHNGSIGVNSELGKGSTFWFKIPAWGSAAAVKPSEALVPVELPDSFQSAIIPGQQSVDASDSAMTNKEA